VRCLLHLDPFCRGLFSITLLHLPDDSLRYPDESIACLAVIQGCRGTGIPAVTDALFNGYLSEKLNTGFGGKSASALLAEDVITSSGQLGSYKE